MNKTKVLISFGTRPEAIKMAPLVLALRKDSRFYTKVLVTAQHREMLDQVLDIFKITPDYDLNLMSHNQSLTQLASNILTKTDPILKSFEPDIVLVHGDTLSANIVAQCAFFNQTDIAHIEAGLRTNNLKSPWPEEANRQIISRISTLHFAPTTESANNLLRENISKDKVYTVGNTVIDALLHVSKSIPSLPHENQLKNILVTCHRRENFGSSFEQICLAIKQIAITRKDVNITFPVHKNPYVQEIVYQILSDINNVSLVVPQDYYNFIKLMKSSYLILTDSGGIQEEAPSLGKPVLVMRNTTERQEAVNAGTVKLVGADLKGITTSVYELLDNHELYKKMANSQNPYGNGNSAQEIVNILASYY